MIRQLFTSAGGVPEGKRPTGAAPFSVALHALAVGALLYFSSQKIANTDTHLPIPIYQPTPPPAVETAIPVVSLGPKPKAGGGTPKPAAPPLTPVVSAASTPKPFVQPPAIPDDYSHEHDNDAPAMGNPNATGAGAPCVDCPVEPGDPNGVSNGSPGAPIPMLSTGPEAPRKIHDVMPKYPELARQIHLEGVVQVECVIGPDGKVKDAHITSHSSPLFDNDARSAVLQWTYTPPKYNGRPVSVLMTVTVRFHLRR